MFLDIFEFLVFLGYVYWVFSRFFELRGYVSSRRSLFILIFVAGSREVDVGEVRLVIVKCVLFLIW